MKMSEQQLELIPTRAFFGEVKGTDLKSSINSSELIVM